MTDYMGLLRQSDDPVHYDAPPDLDLEAAESRMRAFAHALSIALGVSLRTESGVLLQDANYHGEVFLPSTGAIESSIRFSNFGNLVTIFRTEDVRSDWVNVITDLIEEHGYSYVPEAVLQQSYTGRNKGISGVKDWFQRYFVC
jgi:hypothetical protein